MPTDPGVTKGYRLGKHAKEFGWTPNMNGELKDGKYCVTLVATRNDEGFYAYWIDGVFTSGSYNIFDKFTKLTHSKEVIKKIEGWPDLADLFKAFPKANRPNLVRTYRKLPFEFDDDNEEIISKLLGHKIFWWSHLTYKYHADVVLPKQNAKCRIVDLSEGSHRKLFHFIGAQVGFRSVILDNLLKVA